MHARVGRADKDPLPPEIKRRDPKLDVARASGSASTSAPRPRWSRSAASAATAEFVRIGEAAPGRSARATTRAPTEIGFDNLGRHGEGLARPRDHAAHALGRRGRRPAARAMRHAPGDDQPRRAAATVTALPLLRERLERARALPVPRPVRSRRRTRCSSGPAPPIIDEEGIGSHDPFDPIELYAYYVGLTVNQRLRGIHLKYAVTMPTGWSPERPPERAHRLPPRHLPEPARGHGRVPRRRSPRGHRRRARRPSPSACRPSAPSTSSRRPIRWCSPPSTPARARRACLFGILRQAKSEERDRRQRPDGRVPRAPRPAVARRRAPAPPPRVPRLDAPTSRHARGARVPFERPHEEPAPDEAGDELPRRTSPEARANVQILKDLLRPLLEQSRRASSARRPRSGSLTADGEARDVSLDHRSGARSTQAIEALDPRGRRRPSRSALAEALDEDRPRPGSLRRAARHPRRPPRASTRPSATSSSASSPRTCRCTASRSRTRTTSSRRR